MKGGSKTLVHRWNMGFGLWLKWLLLQPPEGEVQELSKMLPAVYCVQSFSVAQDAGSTSSKAVAVDVIAAR